MAKQKKEIEEKKESEKKIVRGRDYLFPDVVYQNKHGVVIRAVSQEEAIKKLNDLISNL